VPNGPAGVARAGATIATSSLLSLRSATNEFKAIFADIERDMARQRAELAARPRDAPLDLAAGRAIGARDGKNLEF